MQNYLQQSNQPPKHQFQQTTPKNKDKHKYIVKLIKQSIIYTYKQQYHQMQQQHGVVAPADPHPDCPIYERILQKLHAQFVEIKPITATTSLLTHILFKAIVMVLFYFDQIFNELVSMLVTAQLTIIFVVVDFWFTKNVNGRRLIGIKWYFGEDQYGNERFMYQVRINQEYASPVNSKLFWIMQMAYIVVPIVDIGTTIVIAPNLYRISYEKVFINLIVVCGGLSNMFLFYKANSAATQKLMELKRKFPQQFLRKLSKNSLVSYI